MTITHMSQLQHLQDVNDGVYVDPGSGLLYGPNIEHVLLPEATTQPPSGRGR